MTTPVVAALKRARKMVVERGVQRAPGSLETCAGVAIMEAVHEWGIVSSWGPLGTACWKAVSRAMGIDETPSISSGVTMGEWNDAHTKRQVLAAFDRAIAAEEAGR